MKKILFLFFTLILLVTSQQVEPIGARAIVLKDGVRRFVEEMLPSLSRRAEQTQLPDIEGEERISVIGVVKYSLSKIKIDSFKISSVSVDLLPPNRVFAFVGKLDLNIKFNWGYKQVSFPYASGSGTGEASAANSGLTLIVAISRRSGKPYFQHVSTNVRLNSFTIRASGGVSSWLINLFTWLFSGTVNELIVSTIEKTVVEFINEDFNKLIAAFDFIQPIPSTNMKFDFRLSEDPYATTNFFRAGIRALGVPNKYNYQLMKSNLPDRPVNDRMIQLFLSDISPKSILNALYVGNDLSFEITNDMVPSVSPVKLTTGSLKLYIRELDQFGNKNLKLSLFAISEPQFNTDPTGVKIVGKFDLLWWLEEEPGKYRKLFLSALDVFAHLNIGLESLKEGTRFNLKGAIEKVELGITLKETYMGPVDLSRFNTVLNIIIVNGMVRAWNRELVEGMPFDTLNSIWPDWAKLLRPLIVYNDKYILLSGDLLIEIPPLKVSDQGEFKNLIDTFWKKFIKKLFSWRKSNKNFNFGLIQ